MTTDPANDADAIINVAMAHGADVRTPYELSVGERYAFVMPNDYKLVEVNTEADGDTPARAHGSVTLTTTESFVKYVNRHKSDASMLYANADNLAVVAVLNDHDQGQRPGWRDLRAALKLTFTPAWQRWTTACNRYLTQEDFAELIDSGMSEIVSPPGADLLEMSQTIKVSKTANFRSQVVRRTGQVQLTYVEEVDGRAGKDDTLTIPETVRLLIEPFYGAEPINLVGRVRYKLEGSHLRIGVWLDRPAEALRQAFDAELGRITGDTGLETLWGTP